MKTTSRILPFASMIAMLTALPVDAQNLLVNGDFEDGTAGWSSGEAVTGNPYEGNACL